MKLDLFLVQMILILATRSYPVQRVGSDMTYWYAGPNSVTLADSGGEGTPPNYMGPMHLAQTAGHGVLPGPPGSGMENTFLAQVCTRPRTTHMHTLSS